MSLKLLIFDLDGTLVDTSVDIAEALNHATSPYGIAHISVEETVELIGEGVTRLIEKALGKERGELRDKVRERFIDYYSRNLTVHSRPYPYIRETLENLVTLRKAVLSNKLADLSERLLIDLGLYRYFDLIAGSDSAPEKKPSAVPVQKVLTRLGIDATDSAIVGDSLYDIEAGRNAGVKTIAVTYGYRPRSELGEADYIIDSFSDLVPLLTTYSALLERRRETRYEIPDVFQKYLEMRVRIADELIPVRILDFSEHGFRIESPVPLDEGKMRECTVSAPRSLQREVALTALIRHCHEEGNVFVAGARIEKVESELWFRVFKSTLKYITERSGEIF
jgi:phosphoglycolate phosphatase